MVLLVAGLLAGVWGLVWDMFLVGPILGSYLVGVPGQIAQPQTMWVVIGNLVAGLVLVSVYARTRSIFGTGLAGGATYGVYAGVLVNFPTWLFLTVYAGWPYRASWALTIGGLVVATVGGALIGLVYEKMGQPKAA